MIPVRGSVSSRNISSKGWQALGFRNPVSRIRRANTTPALATERRLHRPRNRGHASRPLPRCRHQPRRHQRGSREGPVEFQIFGKGSKNAADQFGSRVISSCASAKIRRGRELALQKPLGGTWLERIRHAPNFSTTYMREVGGKEYFEALMAAFDKYRTSIAVYGPDNHLRLTGLHETQSIDKFNYWCREPRSVRPRPAQLRQQRLQGLPGRPPSEFPKATPTRLLAVSCKPSTPSRRRIGTSQSYDQSPAREPATVSSENERPVARPLLYYLPSACAGWQLFAVSPTGSRPGPGESSRCGLPIRDSGQPFRRYAPRT